MDTAAEITRIVQERHQLLAQVPGTHEENFAEAIDAIVAFAVPTEGASVEVCFDVQPTTLALSSEAPDFVLHFDSISTLEQILGNIPAAFLAFQAEQFRSSGYLLWTFQLLRRFSPADV